MVSKKDARGWRLLVFMSRFCLKVIEDGAEISLGILMPALKTRFNTSSAVIGLLLSLHVSLWYVAAPLAQLLLDRSAHPRTLTTICGLLAGVIMICTAFTENVVIFGSLSISSALCASVLHRQAPLLLHQYFPTNFAFISISSFFGAIVGSLVIPLITSLSLMAYGVSGALLILGGVYSHMVPAGYALKAPRGGEDLPVSASVSGNDVGGGGGGGGGELCNDCETDDSKDTTTLISQQKKNGGKLEDKDVSGPSTDRLKDVQANAKHKHLNCEMNSIEAKGDAVSDIGDSAPKESFHGENDDPRYNDDRTIRNHGESLPHNASDMKTDNYSKFIQLIKDVIHFDFLVSNPFVSCTLIPSVGVSFVVIGGWDLFEVSYGISQGLDRRMAYVIPFASVTGCSVSLISLTIILRYKPQCCVFLFFFSCCWSALGFFLMTLHSSFSYILAMSFAIGLGANGVIVTCEGVIDVVVDNQYFADGSTLVDLTTGLGLLLSGFVAGYIKDITGSMKTVYWSLGGLNLLACLLIMVLVCKVACNCYHKN